MAVRISAVTDYLGLTANLPNLDPVTVCAWVYLTSDRNAIGTMFFWSDGSNFVDVGVSTDGTTLWVVTNNGNTTGTSISTGTWCHLAFVHSGTSLTLYLNAVSDVARTDAITFTHTVLLLGSNSVTTWIDGRLAHIKLWNAALTLGQIQSEMRTVRPQRLTNLYAWWPTLPGATERARDYGGAHNLAQAGTPTDEDPPPVSWGAPPLMMGVPPAGAPAITVPPLYFHYEMLRMA